jgi:hypothetical protein
MGPKFNNNVFPNLVSLSCLHSLPLDNNKDCLSTYPFQSMVETLELPYIASFTSFIANVATFFDKTLAYAMGSLDVLTILL